MSVGQRKRIALIAFPPDYFGSFARALEQSDFDVFWVHVSRSEAQDHARLGTAPPDRILDTTQGFTPDLTDVDRCRRELSELEHEGGPRINDIILMDRVLRHKSYAFALCYLAHIRRTVERFLTQHAIRLVNSGRDTATQLVIMLLCRRLGIGWVVPTRARIPQDMFMFASGHETASVVPIRPVEEQDRVWADRFLRDFLEARPKPALKAAATGFSDVSRMLPQHARLFGRLVARSVTDRGNDYARYTIGRLMAMYARRRYNMLRFKLFPPYTQPGHAPFCVYALHTQPESSIDVAGSFFSDQIALITTIARSLPATHELYIKIHPTDIDGKALSFYRTIVRIPGVRLINYDVNSRELVKRASIVFVLTGTIGYEAGLSGKPVIAFARNYYNDLPTVHYCDSPPRLAALVDRLLGSDAPEPQEIRERVIQFLATLNANSFRGEFNRMYLTPIVDLTPDDLASLRNAYETVYARLVPDLQPVSP